MPKKPAPTPEPVKKPTLEEGAAARVFIVGFTNFLKTRPQPDTKPASTKPEQEHPNEPNTT